MRGLRVVLAVALGAVLLSLPALAQEKKAYRGGVRAFKSGRYEEAAKLLKESTADDTLEGIAKFRSTGVNLEDYFPHLYLGLTLEKLDQKGDSAKELLESDRQSAVRQRSGPYDDLQAALKRLGVTNSGGTVVIQQVVVATPAPAAAPAARPTAVPTRTQSPQELAALSEGARRFLVGDLEGALKTLAPYTNENSRAKLLSAYALAGRSILAGADAGKLRTEAQQLYRKAKESDPRPDGALVSPAILAVLQP